MDVSKFRKLVALDENDPLSRFALGQALFQEGGTEALREEGRLVVDNWVPDLQAHRITFTLPLINAARVVAFIDADETKAEVLRQVLEPAPGEDPPPAALVQPSLGVVHWFLTAPAAGRLRAV